MTSESSESRSKEIQKFYSLPARRRGDIYCAPWCGGGCTWAEHEAARERAEALAKRLGPGWKTRVWENLGWHSEVHDSTGFWKVHINVSSGKVRGYTAYLGEGGGGRWAEGAETPEKAIKKVLDVARGELASLEKLIATAKDMRLLLTRSVP